MNQHHEGIPLAGHVLFSLQELGNQLRSIRDQGVMVSVYYKQISLLMTWNYEIILTQTQYTFILTREQTRHDWDGVHLKGPCLNKGHSDVKYTEDLALTLTSYLEIQLKANAHPFTKGTLWGKYGADWTEKRKYGLDKWRWTDTMFTNTAQWALIKFLNLCDLYKDINLWTQVCQPNL